MSASQERVPPLNKRPPLGTQNQMSAPGAHLSKYGMLQKFYTVNIKVRTRAINTNS